MEPPIRRRGRPKGSRNKPKTTSSVQLELLDSVKLTEQQPTRTFGSAAHALSLPDIFIRPAKPVPSQVLCTYWWFASERQKIFYQKIRTPSALSWTDDDTLRRHKFTNAYRASDRVSQYLIGSVIGANDATLHTPEELFFRILVFKLFNKIETWQALESTFGEIRWATYDFRAYDQALSRAIEAGERIYSAAYIMACPSFGHPRKHSNHLRLIESMMERRLPARLHQHKEDLRYTFEQLREFPGLGDFLAFQYAIDLNYSSLLDASENNFVVAGPGALDGIRKCFRDIGDYSPADVIKYVCDMQEQAFGALGLEFLDLWGRKLHLIDCQNLFCEVDKYARVHHPDVKGRSERTRIKQIYRPIPTPIHYRYPAKWGLDDRIATDPGYERHDLTIRG